MLRDLAVSLPQARYVEVADLFCRGTLCSYLDDRGLPLLRDKGHFSREGSRIVVAHIVVQLAKQIDRAALTADSERR